MSLLRGSKNISLGMKRWFHQVMFTWDIHSSLMSVPITSKEMETIAFISSVLGRGGGRGVRHFPETKWFHPGGHWNPRRKSSPIFTSF